MLTRRFSPIASTLSLSVVALLAGCGDDPVVTPDATAVDTGATDAHDRRGGARAPAPGGAEPP